jgi:hypothetical protein
MFCLLQRRYSKRLESLLKLRQPKECRHEHDRQPVPCSEPDQHALWSFLERHRCFFRTDDQAVAGRRLPRLRDVAAVQQHPSGLAAVRVRDESHQLREKNENLFARYMHGVLFDAAMPRT